jgi:hypothetical protein
MQTYQSSTKKHNSDGNVLKIHRTPFSTPTTQVLKEHVGGSIKED